jgi:hypothetical protein
MPRFDVLIQSTEDGFDAQVLDAPLRERPSQRFDCPIAPKDLAAFHQAAEDALHPDRTPQPAIPAREIGAALYQALLGGEVGRLFARCRDRFHDQRLEVRLWFRLDDPQAEYLGALPWELLYAAETGEYLARDREISIIRCFKTRHPETPLSVDGPLQVLVLKAAPRTLDLDHAYDQIEQGLRKAGAAACLLPPLTEPTADELRDYLLDHTVHVLHFMGHGAYDEESGVGALALSDSKERHDQLTGEMLADMVQDVDSLRLVFLSGCLTARYGNKLGSPLAHGVAAAVLERAPVPAVVAHQHSISDEAAIRFSHTFYKRLAARDPIDTAVTEGRIRGRWNGWEWRTPVLFLSSDDTQLFVPTEDAARPEPRPAPAATPSPLRLGIRSIHGHGADMDERTDHLLDLTRFFGGRYVKDPSYWQHEIFPRLRDFLATHARERRPLLLDFAAHSSIACAAGWCLESKSGFDVRVRQRISGEGEIEWHPREGEVPETLWSDLRADIVDPEGTDVALALSVSQSAVDDHVRAYAERQELPVRRLWAAAVAPEPGPTAITGGAHARHLAQSLIARLRERHPRERRGHTHLFCAAPNALLFYLGQLAPSVAPLTLYEFAFRAEDAYGRYSPSIRLPPPGETRQPPAGW